MAQETGEAISAKALATFYHAQARLISLARALFGHLVIGNVIATPREILLGQLLVLQVMFLKIFRYHLISRIFDFSLRANAPRDYH